MDTVDDCRVEMMSQAKTSRAVKVLLFNNRRKINEEIQHEEKFFRVLEWTLSLLFTSHKKKNTKMSLNHFYLSEQFLRECCLFYFGLFLFILSAISV